MQPTLIIGIGGSGMKVGHALKYLFGRFLPNELLRYENNEYKGNVKFLFIDNDQNENERGRKILGTMQSLYNPQDILKISGISPNSIVEEVKRYRNGKISKLKDDYVELNQWLDTHVNLYYPKTETLIGLEGRRQLGRLYLYFNYNKVADAIDKAFTGLNEINKTLKDQGNNKKQFNVIVISGISGGTGSSMFLDVSALVDYALGDKGSPKKMAALINTNLYLKEKEDDGFDSTKLEYRNLQMNSWAFIQECEYFIKNLPNDQTLLAEYCARPKLFEQKKAQAHHYVFSPFDNAVFFDYQCNNQAIIPKNKFFQAVSNILFYSITTQGKEDFDSHIYANQFNPQRSDKVAYGVLGYKTVKFPSELFTEYFQLRYNYELFSKILLNKNLVSSDFDESAKSFVNNFFEDKNGKPGIIFSKVGDDFHGPFTQSQAFESRKSIGEQKYMDDKGKYLDINEINDIITSHNNILSETKKVLEANYQDLCKAIEHEFILPFKGSNKYGDISRLELWSAVYNIIVKNGYYGVIGIYEGQKEVKGFLEEVKEILKKLYMKLNQNWTSISDHINKLRTEVDSLGNNIVNSKKKDLKENLDSYTQKLNELFDKQLEYYIILLKQKILYVYAVGTDSMTLKDSLFKQRKEGYTFLEEYKNQLGKVVGTVSSGNYLNLQKLVESNQTESKEESFFEKFNNQLRNRFIESDKDVFTMYIPHKLSDFISAKGWAAGSDLDETYKKQIKMGEKEVRNVFLSDEVNRDMMFLLTRIGESANEVGVQIDEIKSIPEKYFKKTYLNPNTEISSFLNQNVIYAYRNASPSLKKQIKDDFHNVNYPVYLRNQATLQEIGPYINIPDDAEFEKMVISEFDADPNKIVRNNFLNNDQVVLVKYWENLNFEDISGADLMQVAYTNRDINIYRPHLNKDWNDYIDGIWNPKFAMLQIKDEIPLKWNGSEININYLQAFQLCYIIDVLNNIDGDIKKQIFLEDSTKVRLNNAENKPPVHFDNTGKCFIYFTDYNVSVENEKEKFFLIKSKTKANKKKLPLSVSNISFDQSIKELMSDSKFLDTFQTFSTVLSENYDEIHDIILKHKEEIIQSSFVFDNVLDKITKYNKGVKYSENDKKIASSYIDNLDELMNKLFDIPIR